MEVSSSLLEAITHVVNKVLSLYMFGTPSQVLKLTLARLQDGPSLHKVRGKQSIRLLLLLCFFNM